MTTEPRSNADSIPIHDWTDRPPVSGEPTLRISERHAAESILNRRYADPDDDSAVVARAALRLAEARATPPSLDWPDPKELANALYRDYDYTVTPDDIRNAYARLTSKEERP